MEEKKKHKTMIGIEVILLGMIIAIVGTNASSNPPSNGVSYSKNNQTTVEGALNDLYNKANYGNATESQILKGRTALVGGKKVTGTYVAPTLASQTSGDATAENIDEGKIAWVNGKKIIGIKQISLADKVQLGDYVEYIPNKTSYIVTSANTGYSSNQTFNPSELHIWRVVRKNNDGTVELLTEYLPSKVLIFGPAYAQTSSSVACKNYVGVLNAVAQAYENYGYTISSRAMGYNGVEEEYMMDLDEFDDQDPPTDIELVKTAIGTIEAKRVDKVDSDSFGYWLASRARIDSVLECYGYIVRKKQNYSAFSVGIYDDVHNLERYYFRPIVVLKSNLKITGGDGTESSPYTLGI